MKSLQQNPGTLKHIQKAFHLSGEDMGLIQLCALEAVKEVVNNESKRGNMIALSLMFSSENREITQHLRDDMVTRCLWRLNRRSTLPLLLKERVTQAVVDLMINVAKAKYQCNSLSKLLRYFSISQGQQELAVGYYN